MKIIIANHIDPSIRHRGDLRTWTQRAFWFAAQGDVVVASDQPDQRFLRYVTALNGIDHQQLRIVVAPPGRHDGLLLDPDSLTDPLLQDAIRAAIGSEIVDQVFALWPSPSVSRLAHDLGLAERLPGAGFFAQGGGELSNNKAVFRAVAAAAGAPIPAGAVCRDVAEAVGATVRLLDQAGAVMVKQAHNGAGMGNQLLVRDSSLAIDHAGARHLHVLDPGDQDAVSAYWCDRWAWASVDGRFPVVVEEFVADADTIYSEHLATEDGTHPTEDGSLHYVGRRLSHQVVPLRGVARDVRQQLAAGGSLLAGAYRALGYRGYLSADAIVTAAGRVLFTEVNAQVSGSLHIYHAIAHGIVEVNETPYRKVVEYHVPPTWAVADWDTFMSALEDLGCGYDNATRSGVIVSMPIIPMVENLAQFVFCIAYGTEHERWDIYRRLDQRFAVNPPGAYSASDRVGVPHQPIPA
jgi:hypothetical protein